jgi:hypothetical protein
MIFFLLSGPMIALLSCVRPWSRAAAVAVVLGLTGCTNLGESFVSGAFADPAKYEYYDCKQMESERKSLAVRTADLQGLMAKAETGVGGSVVAEVAYGNEYLSLRAQSKMAEEAWRRYKCRETPPGAAQAASAALPTPTAKGEHQRSGSAVY